MGRPEVTAQERIQLEYERLVASDAADMFDFCVRVVLISLSAVALYFATGYAEILIWGAGYAGLEFLNMRCIRRTKTPVTYLRFSLLAALSIVSILWVGAMAAYLSIIDDGDFLFLGCCICVGMGLYVLTNHGSFGIAALIDMTAVALTAAGVIGATIYHAPTQSVGVAIGIGGTAVLIYFINCFRKMTIDRLALQESHNVLAHDQKLRSLGQLTSGVAHDFNNLLTVISGNIELALLNDSNLEQRARLAEANHAAHRGAALVAQLLAYSRKSSLNAQNVSSLEILNRIEEIADRVAPAGIQTQVDADGDQAVLLVDPGLLETAILNLLINARDALEGGYGHILVRTNLMNDARQLAISVEDNGPGMDASTMERATEPFFTTKGPGKGTGLGLSMVRGFAEQSGGSLVLSNRAGGGLVASILLPVAAHTEFSEAI